MYRLFFLLLTAGTLATAPRLAAAQDGGYRVLTTARTQFLFKDGEVVRRDGDEITALTKNVKLSSGVKINYKNGIVEMPADKVHPKGKKLTLHEGDYVRADGGVVFATPYSAAAAQGKSTPDPDAKFEPYVQRGTSTADPAIQVSLLNKKIDLLTQKVSLLSQGRTDVPDTKAIDEQLAQLDAELKDPK